MIGVYRICMQWNYCSNCAAEIRYKIHMAYLRLLDGLNEGNSIFVNQSAT
jgi:hypothetical protein